MNMQVSCLDGELLSHEYNALLESLPDAILVIDKFGRIALANSRAHALFGYGASELPGESIDILVPESQRKDHSRHVETYARSPRPRGMGMQNSLAGRRKDGSEFPLDIMLGPFNAAAAPFVICSVRDVTAQRAMQDALAASLERERLLARTDTLTGAANSRHFLGRLEQEMDRTRRYRRPFSVAYLDLDNFKLVNDSQGHGAGDLVLCQVAACVHRHARESDLLARLGGDEFSLLLPETDDVAAFAAMTKLHHELQAEMHTHGWPVTFSVGVLTCHEVPESSQCIITMVDKLMYGVKREGKNALRFGAYPKPSAAPGHSAQAWEIIEQLERTCQHWPDGH